MPPAAEARNLVAESAEVRPEAPETHLQTFWRVSEATPTVPQAFSRLPEGRTKGAESAAMAPERPARPLPPGE